MYVLGTFVLPQGMYSSTLYGDVCFGCLISFFILFFNEKGKNINDSLTLKSSCSFSLLTHLYDYYTQHCQQLCYHLRSYCLRVFYGAYYTCNTQVQPLHISKKSIISTTTSPLLLLLLLLHLANSRTRFLFSL